MEEKKLTDEEIVAKNAITDEEIAKAILQQIEYNAGIPYIDEWLKVKTIKFTDILNFIHRLQAENKELKSPKFASWKLKFFNLKEEFDKELAEHEEFAKEAKAEIERLTEERDVYLDDCSAVRHKLRQEIEEKFELQKQVDELLNRRIEPKIFQCHADALEKCPKVEQAVKDTAKEALEAFICKLVNSRLVSTKEDLYVEMLETKDDLLKECYGVEVE